ncbi:MAG: hypothetical protein AVDCRST_MAG51-1819 [uncultured Ramlibacter sp.]|uniref:Inner membrane protein YbaN n=1 Tax=uncultured Ramlibacter sp. TaxID=260755 RepID=A0A6J4PJ94_9BURK|nr:MAG: hypothetical protein AVDCRST_MAG51-1819 [uncultured Ramlibacter sp.]
MADTDTAPRAPLILRWLLLLLAVASLVLAVIGLFLPVVPSVPFVLLAAWAAARSSPRLSRWLENHPRMGPYIRDWRNGGVVSRRAKWMATALMSVSAAGMLLFAGPRWQVFAGLAALAAVLLWLWFRPETAPG